MKVGLYCACGAGAKGEMPEAAVAAFQRLWQQVHSGPDCRECTKAEALAAMRRNEAAEVERGERELYEAKGRRPEWLRKDRP